MEVVEEVAVGGDNEDDNEEDKEGDEDELPNDEEVEADADDPDPIAGDNPPLDMVGDKY